MAKGKLNNVLSFKEHTSLCKLENKPGKVLERFESHNEGILWDSKEEKIAKAEKAIMEHPVKREVYEKFKKEDPNKAKKYLEFFVKNPDGHPKWVGDKFVDTARYSYELGSDIGSPKSGY